MSSAKKAPNAAEAAKKLPTSTPENASPMERAGTSSPEATGKPTTAPTVSPAVHKAMVGNKRANTKPELLVRQCLRRAGLTGYRLQWKVPGRPDVAWPGKRVALFINGCFWHRCPKCNLGLPKSNIEYWVMKFERNVERDKKSMAELRDLGWKVHVVWECELKKKAIGATMATLLPKLAQDLEKDIKPLGPGF